MPGSVLFKAFSKINDPRVQGRSKYKLIDVLVMVLCGTICGCDTLVEIEEYAKSKIDWFKLFLGLEDGIPSHDTLGRILAILQPEEMQLAFQEWADALKTTLYLEEDIINIDGKYLYSSKGATKVGKSGRRTFFGMVNAYSSLAGIAIAQLRTDYAKKSEIDATRELIRRLDLTHSTVTLDAASSQPETTEEIKNQGGDYLIALKKNQRNLFRQIEKIMTVNPTKNNSFDLAEKGHGREEHRLCIRKNLSKKFLEELDKYYAKRKRPTWKGLKTAIKIASTRVINGKAATQTRYYLSSLDVSAERFQTLVRSHWSIENKLHYVLDVTFDEDRSRIRKKGAGENMAVLRQTALNLLSRCEIPKKSMKTKRLICGWNEKFLMQVLLGVNIQASI